MSNNAAGRDLTELTRAGLLEPKGEKRGRHYIPSLLMRAAAAEVGAEVGKRFPVDADPYELGAHHG